MQASLYELGDASAYLNAGGRGTRLKQQATNDPARGVAKALIEVGQPAIRLIDHQLNFLHRAGFSSIIVGAGDQLAVREYLERRYSSSAVTVATHLEQLGTAGDLLQTKRDYGNYLRDLIFIHNVDTILDIDPAVFAAHHRRQLVSASIALTLRTGVPNEGAYLVDAAGRVVYSAEAVHSEALPSAELVAYRGSSTGAVMMDRTYLDAIEWEATAGPFSLYGDVLGEAINTTELGAFNNYYRFFQDIGTPQALKQAQSNNYVGQAQLCY